MAEITHIVMDIEGTVAPISFVHEKMFPYVRNNLNEYLTKTWSSELTQGDIQALIAQSQVDEKEKFPSITYITLPITTEQNILQPQIVANVLSQMDIDRKIGALKQLQGHIWKEAFDSRALVAELFSDVYPALKRWSAQKKHLSIYSSGSISAQKLLFGHTQDGDLLSYLEAHFDTTSGHKREVKSYETICGQLQVAPEQCLFLTDIYEEATAAQAAKWNVYLLVRPGNGPLPAENVIPTKTDFNSIFP